MLGNQQALINEIRELTDSMLSAGKIGDWVLLEKLESEREAVLPLLFENPEFDDSCLGEVRAMIQMVLKMDREISDICTAEADDCRCQLASIIQANKMVASYTAYSK